MNEQDPRAARRDEGDLPPGMPIVQRGRAREAVTSYVIGLVLSIGLTAGSFYLLRTHAVWRPAIPIAMIALAVAQIGVHLVFFLHITTAPDNTNNVLALAFGILIVGLVVAGSIWIMGHLDRNMLPAQQAQMMRP